MKKLETLVATTMENPDLIKPEKFRSALETRRNIQKEASIEFINHNKGQLATVEGWLTTLSEQCERRELEALGVPICDAVVYPRCPLIFGDDINEHDKQLAIFLKSHYIPVRSVGNVATCDESVAFVYLLDSDNAFTVELVKNLDNSLNNLAL